MSRALRRSLFVMARYKAASLSLAVFLILGTVVPGFLSAGNQIALLKSAGTPMFAAIGCTFVLVSRNLDLSFGVAATLAGMLTLGLQAKHGWAIGAGAGLTACVALGLVNGLLVAKARIHSFIATLGTMTLVQGVIEIYSKGGTISIDNYVLADFLDKPSFLAPPILAMVATVALLELVLHKSVYGMNLKLTGGNPKAAWHAGINTVAHQVSVFVLCSVLAGLGGILVAIKDSSVNPTAANGSIVTVITAAIIGGATLTGGKGSVVGTSFAILLLTGLTNGLGLNGLGTEVQLLASGVVLAIFILQETISNDRSERRKGVRLDLLAEQEAATSS